MVDFFSVVDSSSCFFQYLLFSVSLKVNWGRARWRTAIKRLFIIVVVMIWHWYLMGVASIKMWHIQSQDTFVSSLMILSLCKSLSSTHEHLPRGERRSQSSMYFVCQLRHLVNWFDLFQEDHMLSKSSLHSTLSNWRVYYFPIWGKKLNQNKRSFIS